MIWKISDLNKYDMPKVKESIKTSTELDKDEQAMMFMSYTNMGYKCLKIMIFNELAYKLSNVHIGMTIALLNIKPLKPTMEKGYCFVIDAEAQVL